MKSIALSKLEDLFSGSHGLRVIFDTAAQVKSIDDGIFYITSEYDNISVFRRPDCVLFRKSGTDDRLTIKNINDILIDGGDGDHTYHMTIVCDRCAMELLPISYRFTIIAN